MKKEQKRETLGPVGSRAIVMLAYAANIVVIKHRKAGRIVLIRPSGIAWLNVWFVNPPPT